VSGGGQLEQATAGPATAKFFDASKLYKQMGDMLQNELSLLEAAEGVSLNMNGVGIPPAYLLSVGYPPSTGLIGESVISRGIIDMGGI
jgi:hypothetical protein